MENKLRMRIQQEALLDQSMANLREHDAILLMIGRHGLTRAIKRYGMKAVDDICTIAAGVLYNRIQLDEASIEAYYGKDSDDDPARE